MRAEQSSGWKTPLTHSAAGGSGVSAKVFSPQVYFNFADPVRITTGTVYPFHKSPVPTVASGQNVFVA